MPGFGFDIFRYNPLMGGTPPVSYLVDDYSPTAAFSIRKISSTATNCIRVRRSNDNAEQDIGFVGNDLDTASLASFVGANSGFVTTWYDQSGNGWDVSVGGAVNQPRIVNAGTIDSLGSHKSLVFNNGQQTLGNALFSTTLKPFTAFAVGSVDNASYGTFLNSGGGGTMDWGHTNGFKNRLVKAAIVEIAVSTNAQTNGAQTLNGVLYDSSGGYAFYKDGAANGSGTNNQTINATTDLWIGSESGGGAFYRGEMQEILLWTSDATANRTAIETDINSYYGIY